MRRLDVSLLLLGLEPEPFRSLLAPCIREISSSSSESASLMFWLMRWPVFFSCSKKVVSWSLVALACLICVLSKSAFTAGYSSAILLMVSISIELLILTCALAKSAVFFYFF